MSDLGRKVKGQPCPSGLILSHCLIRFYILSENNDFDCNSFQKINLKKIIKFKCIMMQIDLCAIWVKVNPGSSVI